MVKGLLLQSLWIWLCYSQKRNWRRTQNPLRNVHTTVFGNHFPASDACLLGVKEFPSEIYFQSEAILVKFLHLQSESLVTRLKPAWLVSVYSVYKRQSVRITWWDSHRFQEQMLWLSSNLEEETDIPERSFCLLLTYCNINEENLKIEENSQSWLNNVLKLS